jgi:AcrR family transcriptional regulator
LTTQTDLPKQHRNAAATREAILESARSAFVGAGYEGAGVREIAKGAGVTAMLVNRYFGSKENLFAEVLARSMAQPVIATQQNLHSPDRVTEIAKALVAITTTDGRALDGFLIMLRSASSPRAAEIARLEIEKHHQRTLTAALDGPFASQRAAILLSLVAGVQIMRQMIGLSALNDTAPEVLIDLLRPIIQSLCEAGETELRP